MVENDVKIRTNFKITELENKKIKSTYETHNAVTRQGLHLFVQRMLNKPLNNDYTNHRINLLAFGFGASDISTIPQPASEFDLDLVVFANLFNVPGVTIVNDSGKKYIDITGHITYTSTMSWKLSYIVDYRLFTPTTFINEFGLYASTVDFHVPVLFARVTTAPFIIKENRLYILEWYFSLGFAM